MSFNLGPKDLPLTGIAHQDRDRLTFAIEFEFAIATLATGEEDPSPEDGRTVFGILDEEIDRNSKDREAKIANSVLIHVAKTMTDAGIKSVEELKTDSVCGHDATAWLVKNDSTIHGPEEETPYAWYSVEVMTPAFYTSSVAIDTVKSACEILTNTYRVSCRRSARMRVHVGRGEKSHVFETLRNLYATIWTFEPQIKQIHPYYRHETDYISTNLRNDSGMFGDLEIEGELSVAAAIHGLDSILNATDTVDLGSCVVGVTRNAYNMRGIIMNLTPGKHDKKEKDTVEFRQHESTLNPIRVENWARLCIGLYEFADTVQFDILAPFLRRHIYKSPKDFTIGQILTSVGLPYLADFFEKQVADQKPKDAEMREAEKPEVKDAEDLDKDHETAVARQLKRQNFEKYERPPNYSEYENSDFGSENDETLEYNPEFGWSNDWRFMQGP